MSPTAANFTISIALTFLTACANHFAVVSSESSKSTEQTVQEASVGLDLSNVTPGCQAVNWDQYNPWVPEYTRYRHCNPVVITENNTVVSGCKFAPCYGGSSCTAITIQRGVTGVQIRDNLFQGYYEGRGISALGDNDGLYIHRNYFTEVRGRSISIYGTREFAIQNNRFHNLRGWGVDASAVLVNNSIGPKIDISSNRVLLKPKVSAGASWTNDVFSVYESGGTSPTQRLTIRGNLIVGGHAGMEHGDGIVVGDGCRKGNYVLVTNNKLINSGLAGITGSGGRDYIISENTIYSCARTNTEEWGAYRAAQQHSWVPDGCSAQACDNIAWRNNIVHARGVGNFGTSLGQLLDFGLNDIGRCTNVNRTGNNWKKTDLTPNFIANDFMNWCEKDLHCPAGYSCSSGKCR